MNLEQAIKHGLNWTETETVTDEFGTIIVEVKDE